ncbi:MAG: hypothetical protein WAL23_06145 [Nitrososphaeraceae archaeon]
MSEYEGLGKGFQIIPEIVSLIKGKRYRNFNYVCQNNKAIAMMTRDEHSEIESYES